MELAGSLKFVSSALLSVQHVLVLIVAVRAINNYMVQWDSEDEVNALYDHFNREIAQEFAIDIFKMIN